MIAPSLYLPFPSPAAATPPPAAEPPPPAAEPPSPTRPFHRPQVQIKAPTTASGPSSPSGPFSPFESDAAAKTQLQPPPAAAAEAAVAVPPSIPFFTPSKPNPHHLRTAAAVLATAAAEGGCEVELLEAAKADRKRRVAVAIEEVEQRLATPTALLRSNSDAMVSETSPTSTTSPPVPDVTKSTWQLLVVESELPVLVEFCASWCGPCKMIDPVIGKLSKEYERKLNCYKLNTDENPDIATQFGIRSIPTMLIFKNGEKKDAVIGAVPESTLVTCIEKYVERLSRSVTYTKQE